jgi:hypothetical protein
MPWDGLSQARTSRIQVGDFMEHIQELTIHTSELKQPHVANALASLGVIATAYLASEDIKCTLATPPSEVITRPIGPNDSMLSRCFHDPAHCWRMDGDRVTCPL